MTEWDEGDRLALRFGLLPRLRRIVWYADIDSVEVGRTLILDGWGIHFRMRGAWVWNLWGRDCVVVRLKNGEVPRIGTDDVPNRARFLEGMIDRQGASTSTVLEGHEMKKVSKPVDEFIDRMPPEQPGIARSLRAIVRQTAPDLSETIKWGYPCYLGKGNVCSIIPYRDHVNLAFFRGAELDDPDGLLEGTGKAMRHVKVCSVGDSRERALAALVRAASLLEQNA